MRATVSAEWLSGCSGCHVAVIDLHEKLIGLVDELEIIRMPVLLNERGYPRATVGLVEGAVRSDEDRRALELMRGSVDTLIAFGSCAVYGGPSGLGWLCDSDEVLETVYDRGPTNTGGGRPGEGAPRLEESVVPIDEIVDVDLYLPGCPPHPYFIAAALRIGVSAGDADLPARTVCARCERSMRPVTGARLAAGAVSCGQGSADAGTCFLCQGVVCLGSVTLDRCTSPCPGAGVACTGCAGPSFDLIVEPHLEPSALLARRMSMVSGIDESEIRSYLEKEARTFHAYAVASRVIHGKQGVDLHRGAGQRRVEEAWS